MAVVDKRARELLAAEYAKLGDLWAADQILRDRTLDHDEGCVLRAISAALTPPDVSATTQRLIDLLIERDKLGRAKYGTTLDRTDLTRDQWLQHMVEELLDGAGYALAAQRPEVP